MRVMRDYMLVTAPRPEELVETDPSKLIISGLKETNKAVVRYAGEDAEAGVGDIVYHFDPYKTLVIDDVNYRVIDNKSLIVIEAPKR